MEESRKYITLTDALDAFGEHVEEIEEEAKKHILEVIHEERPNTGEEVHDEVAKLRIEKRTAGLRRTLGAIERMRTPKVRRSTITERDIERARNYPIVLLFEELTGTTTRHGMGHCPFHEDHTASFSMQRNNRFCCFGCNVRGDSIALYMRLTKKRFYEAVQYLKHKV